MGSERVVRRFLDLVAIDSPSRREAAVARHCVEELERLGFEVAFDGSRERTGSDTDQIIARRAGSTAARIALSAHMDCVLPCEGVKASVVDGVIRTDGTTVLGSDDKSGIAEILEGIERLDESGEPTPHITVLLSVCEEQSVAGAPHFPERLFDEETLCLVMDAEGGAGAITVAAPYHWVYEARFAGRAAHAGVNPQDGVNAIGLAAAAIAAMPSGRIDEATTCNVGLIEGGRAKNIVADSCVVRGECRSLHEERADALRERIDAALREAAQAGGGQVEVDWELSYPGFAFPEDDPDVALLEEAARAIGVQPRICISGGGSDANVLGPKGAKAIPLGTGMTDFHSVTEHISVEDLDRCSEYVAQILKTVAARG